MNINTEAHRLSLVWETLVTDTQLSRYVGEHDIVMFRRRVEAEGLDFLTVTLPALGKSLDASFESGQLVPVVGFKKVKSRPYPLFLRKAWETLFDENGALRWYESSLNGLLSIPSDVDTDYANAAFCIRQLTLMFYKMKLPYSPDKIASTIASFRRNEEALGALNWDLVDASMLTRARRIVHRLVSRVNPRDISPRHGSGSSACGVPPYLRYGNPRYIPKLDKVYPYTEFFFSGIHGLSDNLATFQETSVLEEPVAKVVLVPKDSRGPRLISMEPRETMYIQQGLMDLLYTCIESYPNVRCQLSCVDQSRNQFLAGLASTCGSHATIDMKDASDLVSVKLVEALFPSNWVECFEACRSSATVLPDGSSVVMKKFAPMGSAVCFPVEAIVFWAISLAACGVTEDYINRLFRFRHSREQVFNDPNSLDGYELHQLAVFGDDIICPTHHVNNVMEALESVGLTVNKTKCFTRGPFRESCGGDYFLGRNISPVRISHLPVVESRSRYMMNYSKFRCIDWMNNLIDRFGWPMLTDPLRDLYESWYGDVAVIPSQADGSSRNIKTLGLHGGHWFIPAKWKQRLRSCDPKRPFYCKSEVFIPQELAKSIEIDNGDWCHVLRSLLGKGGFEGTSIVSLAKRHKYKYGWLPLFNCVK